ncbi:phosphotransferase [Bacillus sp. sid0103]|uniref:phosphotransferase n=1 Tax=Bacillus sp. sid0103 TaxID=2856337 RepID=UPI001C45E25A|nr:phosphotransferase [Bacillus sp. sid0103]MBV7506335.1 phosphotransferase [Bacillus sp. sid0103]
MTNSWSPEIELSPQEAMRLIANQFPDLHPIHIRLFGQGFDNSVFMVNDQYVFRFPRRTSAVQLLFTENHLLPHLTEFLNFQIPVPVFLGRPCPDYPWPFTGYQVVSGMTPGILSESIRSASAERMAVFLRKLHQFSIEKAKSYGVPYDQLNRVSIKLRKDRLVENVTKAVNDRLLKHPKPLLDYLNNLKIIEEVSNLSLVHGDLHFRNVLVDSNGHISGIIDWGDVHIGNPAVDLSFVYSFFPPLGRKQFFEAYGDVDGNTRYLAKFKAIFTTVILLRYAHDLSDSKMKEAALQGLNFALVD